jgi:hypothetical protein
VTITWACGIGYLPITLLHGAATVPVVAFTMVNLM